MSVLLGWLAALSTLNYPYPREDNDVSSVHFQTMDHRQMMMMESSVHFQTMDPRQMMVESSENGKTCSWRKMHGCVTCAHASAAMIALWESYFCPAATSLPARHAHRISGVVCVVTRLSVPQPTSSSVELLSEV